MVKTSIIGFDSVLGSAMIGINDLLSMAGDTWNSFQNLPQDMPFDVKIASRRGKTIKAQNNVSIAAHCTLEDTHNSDIYLIPAITGDVEAVIDANPDIVELLKNIDTSKCMIGGNSTGVFFLAEAGLLDNKVATTHWGMAERFSQRYPKVNLRADQVITHDQNIVCNSGGMAWFDFGLYLIENFAGHEIAMQSSKVFFAEKDGATELTFSPLIGKKYHKDGIVLKAQEWIETNYAQKITIQELGERFGLSERSLSRRFQSTIGQSPSHYLQTVRVDAAGKLLMQSNKNVAEITLEVGYEDISSFCKLFKKNTGLTPSTYRARFK